MFYLCTGRSITAIDSDPDCEVILERADRLAKSLREAIKQGGVGPEQQFPITIVHSKVIKTIEQEESDAS